MIRHISLGAAAGVVTVLMTLSACGSSGTSAAADGRKLHTISQIKPAPTKTPSHGRHPSPKSKIDNSANDATLKELATQAEVAVRRSYGEFGGAYTEVDVRPAPPSGLKVVYVFSHSVDPSTAAVSIAQALPTMRTVFRTLIAPQMESAGIAYPRVTYLYLNPDRSPVWSRTFRTS